ncbi:MAG: septal ring lytic transglycosylase RlpA family protein [Lautropia sp.]
MRVSFMRALPSRFATAACAALFLQVLMPSDAVAQAEPSSGKIAWYGAKFAGRPTASGERFDPNALTMAHKTLPFGTRVKVTNRTNGRSVVLRVNDRGPTQPDRIGDVSRAAALRLGMTKSGVVDAVLEPLGGPPARRR